MPSYTIVDVPERWVVGTRDVIPADSMVTFFDRVYNDTADRITDVGGSVLGPAVAYYFTPVVDTVDMLGGFPVVADVAAKTSGAVQCQRRLFHSHPTLLGGIHCGTWS